jgi:kynurenine formamidase
MSMADNSAVDYVSALSNWGRWGDHDELGTLNLVDDAARVAAARLVRDGGAVSCAWPITGVQRFMKRSAEGLSDPARDPRSPRWHSTVEHLSFQFHGATMTHLDAPSHMFWDGYAYNGVPGRAVNTEHGATALAVTACAAGVTTRGVLLDLPAVKGLDWLPRGTAVEPSDLEEAERVLNVRVRPADALLIRVGHGAIRERDGVAAVTTGPSSGLDACCMPWLGERDIALLASDATNDVTPLSDGPLPLPVHVLGLRAIGLWLIDNANLEALSAECARRGRYEFCWTMAPLPIAAATGSPVNPIALM